MPGTARLACETSDGDFATFPAMLPVRELSHGLRSLDYGRRPAKPDSSLRYLSTLARQVDRALAQPVRRHS